MSQNQSREERLEAALRALLDSPRVRAALPGSSAQGSLIGQAEAVLDIPTTLAPPAGTVCQARIRVDILLNAPILRNIMLLTIRIARIYLLNLRYHGADVAQLTVTGEWLNEDGLTVRREGAHLSCAVGTSNLQRHPSEGGQS